MRIDSFSVLNSVVWLSVFACVELCACCDVQVNTSYFCWCVCVSTGSPKDPGILPRALDTVFRHVNGRLYEQMDLKPYLNSDVQKLDTDQLKMEKSAKTALFSMLKEVPTQTFHG